MPLQSPIEAIDHLHFEKVRKGKVYKNADVALVWHHGRRQNPMMVARTEKGTFITSDQSHEKFYKLAGNSLTDKAYLQCLLKLGVITQGQLDEHNTWAESRQQRQKDRYAAQSMRRVLGETGLSPTKAQQRFMDKNDPQKDE